MIVFRGGSIYSTGTGIEVTPANVTVSHTDIESSLVAVGGGPINVTFTKFIGAGITYSTSTTTCAANVNSAGTFLASSCP
ncbi:MAG TPA: hypothetical protein VLV54_16540 [Thermoanaerobaculia bacterium]|nr:hypothetical protein [Thermoanaerobaculia bacterium]